MSFGYISYQSVGYVVHELSCSNNFWLCYHRYLRDPWDCYHQVRLHNYLPNHHRTLVRWLYPFPSGYHFYQEHILLDEGLWIKMCIKPSLSHACLCVYPVPQKHTYTIIKAMHVWHVIMRGKTGRIITTEHRFFKFLDGHRLFAAQHYQSIPEIGNCSKNYTYQLQHHRIYMIIPLLSCHYFLHDLSPY